MMTLSTPTHDLGALAVRDMSSLGAVSARQMTSLGAAALSDERITAMAAQIAAQLGTFPPLTLTALAGLLGQYDEATRERLAAAIIAAGGDVEKVNTALKMAKPGFAYYKKYALAWGILSTVSGAVSAYHGYKRNDSVGWALVWFALGSFFPIITPVIAVAQGYSQPK